MDAIKIQNLTKRYQGFTLDNVTFSLPKGSIMGLIGENGAGKSTTINAILDLIKIDSGSITFWDKRLSDFKDLKEDIGVVFEEINFYEYLKVKQTGKICSSIYKRWDNDLFVSYLNKFSLPPDKRIKELSRGMKMKLSIALALSHRPKLLILDEATSGLDPVMRDDILDIFLEFVGDSEHSILMSSHITTDLEKIADYITFINEGRVLFTESKDKLRYEYAIIRCGKADFEKIDRSDILAFRREEYQTSVLVSDKSFARKKYGDLVIDDASIDDIMLIFVKGEKV